MTISTMSLPANNFGVALGRNGTMKVRGLTVYIGRDKVDIAPINSKGVEGRCFISMPRESIPALITELEKAR